MLLPPITAIKTRVSLANMATGPWTHAENDFIVAAYLTMLAADQLEQMLATARESDLWRRAELNRALVRGGKQHALADDGRCSRAPAVVTWQCLWDGFPRKTAIGPERVSTDIGPDETAEIEPALQIGGLRP